MANKISPDDLPQSQIYENGEFYSISIADLKGNEVAIMQLINDYNTKVKTIERLQKSESLLASELQYQNASPFFAIIAAIVNVIGSVISCCGINFMTSDANSILGFVLVIAGSALLLAGNTMMICYKYVYKWMNKNKL